MFGFNRKTVLAMMVPALLWTLPVRAEDAPKLTPEERAAMHAEWEQLTPEQKEARKAEMKAKWDALTPEEKAARKAEAKARWDALPEDRKAAIREKIKERQEQKEKAQQ